MKCTCCGKEIPEGENLCPFCGENIQLSNAETLKQNENKKKRIPIILAAAVCVAGVAAIGFIFAGKETLPTPEEAAKQRTMVSYTTKNAIHTVLPENHRELTLYLNNAKDLSSYNTFSQIISGNATYIGKENFIRMGEEVLYLQTVFNALDTVNQSLDAEYILYSLKEGQEPVIVDTGVQGISCSSEKSVFYSKNVDGMTQQYRYHDGSITPVTELVPADFVLVTHCSRDDSVIGFAAADYNSDGSYQMNNGYLAGETLHRFDNSTSEVYFVSPDGAHIYIIDIEEGGSRAVDVNYVTDIPSGQMMKVASTVSELSFYQDSGAMTCIGEVELSDEIMNPVGKLLYFDPQAQSTQTIAEDAVALVESVAKTYPWLNEASNEMLVTEQDNRFIIPEEVKKGQFHFINKDGAFCAADQNGSVFEVFPDFYVPENYVYASDLYYLTEQNDTFYWTKGDQVYKYRAGSLTAPETVTLDADLLEKIENGVEIGYVLTSDGSVLEQSGNTLNLKPFGEPSSTVYDSPNNIYVIGISSKGDKIYFRNDSSQLFEKEIHSSKEPKLLAEQVQDAVTVENGLYLLTDYSEEDGGTLMYLGYDQSQPTAISSNVMSIMDTVIQK